MTASGPVTAGRRLSLSRLTLIGPTQLATFARAAINRVVALEFTLEGQVALRKSTCCRSDPLPSPTFVSPMAAELIRKLPDGDE
jgi:hypothetical protein